MKFHFASILLIVFICCCSHSRPIEKESSKSQQTFKKGPLTINICFSPKQPTIADRILFDLNVSSDIKYEIQMPQFSDNLGRMFYIHSFFPEQTKIKKQQRIHNHQYELEALVSGKMTIPEIKIIYYNKEKPQKKFTAVVEPIEMDIKPIELDNSEQGITTFVV